MFAQDTPCSGTPPHPVLRVAKGAECLTAPASDSSQKQNTIMPVEVVYLQGSCSSWLLLGVSVFTLRGRNNISPRSCPASFFLFFQGWSCYLTVAECGGGWRTGFVTAHLNGFKWGQSNWLFEGRWFVLTWPYVWLDPQVDKIK